MRRILSFLMALIMAAGVCLCISSCEEAGDTSSPRTESDTSNAVPTGREIIANSAAKGLWDDYVYGSSTKTILAQFGKDRLMVAVVGYNEDHFIRSNEEIDEAKNVIKELEPHIVKELTKDEIDKIDEQRRAESPDDYYLNLLDISLFDGVPEIVYRFGLEPGGLFSVPISVNENYLNIGGVAFFELDGDVSEIIEKIKSIRER